MVMIIKNIPTEMWTANSIEYVYYNNDNEDDNNECNNEDNGNNDKDDEKALMTLTA